MFGGGGPSGKLVRCLPDTYSPCAEVENHNGGAARHDVHSSISNAHTQGKGCWVHLRMRRFPDVVNFDRKASKWPDAVASGLYLLRTYLAPSMTIAAVGR